MNPSLVVNYHYVRPDDLTFASLAKVSPEAFDRQIGSLASHFTLLTPEALAGRDEWPGHPAVVTFDDGLKDVIDYAVPVLRRHNVPAIVFCCSLPLIDPQVLNVHKVHLLWAKLGRQGFCRLFDKAIKELALTIIPEDISGLGLGPLYCYDDAETRSFKTFLNYQIPYDRLTVILDRMFDREIGDQSVVARALYLSKDDLLRCRDAGVMVGIHTHSHKVLSRLSYGEQEEEIHLCFDVLRDLIGIESPFVAYPNGNEGTWNEDTVAVCASLNLPGAFILGRQFATPADFARRWTIPRFDVNDLFERGNDGRLRSSFLASLVQGVEALE